MDDPAYRDILAGYPPQGLALQLAWEAVVLVAPREDLGPGPAGHRFIVPILGGRFTGGPALPGFEGTILPGGADRQTLRPDGIKELSTLYEMHTHDGAVIGIDNRVIVDADRSPERYAVSRIHVTAPRGGRWEVLNRRLFLGSLHSRSPNPGHVVVRAFLVDTAPAA